MHTLVALLLVLAVLFAVLRAFALPVPRVDLGWLALACLFAAVWLIPTLAGP